MDILGQIKVFLWPFRFQNGFRHPIPTPKPTAYQNPYLIPLKKFKKKRLEKSSTFSFSFLFTMHNHNLSLNTSTLKIGSVFSSRFNYHKCFFIRFCLWLIASKSKDTPYPYSFLKRHNQRTFPGNQIQCQFPWPQEGLWRPHLSGLEDTTEKRSWPH